MPQNSLSPKKALASQRADVLQSWSTDLRIVFYGYPQIGVAKSGTAVITKRGLSDIQDITFSSVGGELSPDGRLIAYDNCSSRNRGIYLAEPDGSSARKLISVSHDGCVYIRWSPDSTKLSYVSDPDNALHIFDITRNHDSVLANTEWADWHSWSPAGDQIVYGKSIGRRPDRLLYITNLQGKSRQLTFAKDFTPCESEWNLIDTWDPAWSPRGDRIAFTQCRALFVISPTGERLRQLTAPESAASPDIHSFTAAYSPRWTPDGQWLIFTDGYIFVGTPVSLKRISADGATVVEIGKLPYGGAPFSLAPLKR